MGQAKTRKKNGQTRETKVVPQKSHYSVPHYTAEQVLPLFKTQQVVEIDGDNVVPLTGFFGYLTFSDANGGTAYLEDPDTGFKKLASFSVVITDEMRTAKCSNPKCKKKRGCGRWDDLQVGCGGHKDKGFLMPIKLFASLCKNPECTEQHVWIVSECTDDDNVHHNAHVQLR